MPRFAPAVLSWVSSEGIWSFICAKLGRCVSCLFITPGASTLVPTPCAPPPLHHPQSGCDVDAVRMWSWCSLSPIFVFVSQHIFVWVLHWGTLILQELFCVCRNLWLNPRTDTEVLSFDRSFVSLIVLGNLLNRADHVYICAEFRNRKRNLSISILENFASSQALACVQWGNQGTMRRLPPH